MSIVRSLVLTALRGMPLRGLRHRWFLRSRAVAPQSDAPTAFKARVLVLGVYLADRPNSVGHLIERLASTGTIEVVQRWAAVNGRSADPRVEALTVRHVAGPRPKATIVNELLEPGDLEHFDFVIVSDDDIHLPHDFLAAFLAYQQKLDFSIAQPARTWHSHFDHAFVLRRPWLLARQTHYVESGPLVSFRRDAARLLLPFDEASPLWGLDFVWPEVMGRHGMKMGIVDCVPVDHSMRAQAVSYDKQEQDAAMKRYLATRPHLSMEAAFVVVRQYPLSGRR